MAASDGGAAPGKRTRTQALQPRMTAAPDAAPAIADPPSLSGGAPMTPSVRGDMEHAFGVDLGGVRIHEDSWAGEQGAAAITRGNDIVFAPGQYAPGTLPGSDLLAHELTHVVQQRDGRVDASQASRPGLHIDDALEREADEVGARVSAGLPAGLATRGGNASATAAQPRMVHRGAGRWRHEPDGPRPPSPQLYRKIGDDLYQADDGRRYRYDARRDELIPVGGAPAPSGFRPAPAAAAAASSSSSSYDEASSVDLGELPDADEEANDNAPPPTAAEIARFSLEELAAAMHSDRLDADGWAAAGRRLAQLPPTGDRRRLAAEFAQELNGDAGTGARKKRARPAGPVDPPTLFPDLEDPSESDISEIEDANIDRRRSRAAHNQQLTFAPVANRGHLPQLDEVPEDEAAPYEALTGLGFASTFAAVFRDGSFVPRAVDAHLNTGGHRQRPPEDALRALADRREAARQAEDGDGDDAVARRQLQQGFNSLMFPSGQPLADDEVDEEAVARQNALLRSLGADHSAPADVRTLMSRGAPSGLRSARRDITQTDSEQLVLASRMWASLCEVLLAEVRQAGGRHAVAGHTLRISINRSSCRGCARTMTAALVDFWTRVGQLRGETWQQALAALGGTFRFEIAFPSIYQFPQERAQEFNNFDQIRASLVAVGWTIVVETGFGGGEESNRVARERTGGGGDGADDEASSSSSSH